MGSEHRQWCDSCKKTLSPTSPYYTMQLIKVGHIHVAVMLCDQCAEIMTRRLKQEFNV